MTTSLLSPISYFERDLVCWGGGRDLREGEINQGAKTGRRALIRAKHKKGKGGQVDLLPFHQNKIGLARNQMDPRDGGREKPIATVW